MHGKASPFYQFRDLLQDAGVGSGTWSRWSYLAATYYHHIIAVFTIGILLLTLPRLAGWLVMLIFAGLYAAYFVVRKVVLRPAGLERWFYRSDIQFLRAQAGVIGIMLLMIATPHSEQTVLWILFVMVILLTSKHCSTLAMLILAAESCLALLVVRLSHGAPFLSVVLDADLWGDALGIGLLSFVLHFLVRNLQARGETVSAFEAVSALAHEIDMTDANRARQWQPLLLALIRHVGGECASMWMMDAKKHCLRLTASVRRNSDNPGQIELSDDAHDLTVPLDGSTLIAQVARTGLASHYMSPPDARPELAVQLDCQPACCDICAELVVPITVGVADKPTTIGVLSMGFRSRGFRKRLLLDYQNFMLAVVSQARPMLAYARRLDELIDLQEASRQVWRSFDLDHMLDSILQALVHQFGFDFAVISLVDQEHQVIRSVKGLNVPSKWIELAVHSLDSNDIQADIVRIGKTEVIRGWDDRFDLRIWKRFHHDDMVRVFMPIRVTDALTRQELIIGTIETGYRTAHHDVTSDQLRVLEAFREQACMAIEHARLLQRTLKRADVLASLHEVGQVIASVGQPTEVLKRVADSARALFKANIVMLYRYHRDSQCVDLPVICGAIQGKYRFNLNLNEDNILTQLLRTGEPYYSADAWADAARVPYSSPDGETSRRKVTFMRRHNIKSFAGIPLVAKGETVGIMFVNYRKRHQFDKDEKTAHELFAQQAAVAIKNAENSELARDMIVREERNHLSRELHHSISQHLFGIKLKARQALRCMANDNSAVKSELTDILDIAMTASNETGFIIEELRAPVEEGRYLKSGLEEFAERVRKWYKIEVTLQAEPCRPLGLFHEQVLMRFAREAINNAVRHARCKRIAVHCAAQGDYVTMTVRDDGIGFDPTQVPPHKFGLRNMQELAAKLDGTLSISSAREAGATVSLRIRMQSDTEEAVWTTNTEPAFSSWKTKPSSESP